MVTFPRPTCALVAALLACLIVASGRPLLAQEQVLEAAQPAESAKVRPGPAARAVQPAGVKPGDAKPAESKPGEAKPAEGAKPSGDAAKKPDKSAESVKRPTNPKKPPDAMELKVRPDADGLISFSFKGQPWTDVLEWLADISQLSLHWEEAPAGYLDLTTRGRYTPEEVRDLINSVLLAKGFTILRNGEILVVANLKNLDVSLVPRVRPEELEQRGTYELVKVFFDLNWLVAENVVDEIKPLLSSYGKVSALKATNRLEVLDSAGNLRRIRDLLSEEQSSRGQQRLVRQFKLQHTRATEVLETLNTLLGIKSTKSSSESLTPQQAMMAQQQAMMLAQQQAQQGGQRAAQAAAASKGEQQVFLALNNRENTILANAPPDKMAIIEQAVLAVDVPVDRSQSLLNNLPRLRIYRLSGVAPETLVKVLQDLGGLDPASKLEVDGKNKAIIAYAPLVDHVMIQSLVDRLDGTGRKFEVIQLRLLRAEHVAGSIETLMKGPQEQTTTSRRPYYFDYGYGGGSQSNQPADKFQVDADIEHNRLLLRATDAELSEVRELLVKLGELPADARNPSRMRLVPVTPGEETDELLRRIERIWPSLGGNRLDVDSPPPKQRTSPPAHEAPADDPPAAERPAQPKPGASVQMDQEQPDGENGVVQRTRRTPAKFAELAIRQPAERSPEETEPALPRDAGPGDLDQAERADERPPIQITIGPEGLILSSPDTEALDRLEQLLTDLAPGRPSFKIFTLHHTYAKDVASLLEDVFKEQDDGKSKNNDLFDRYYFGFSRSSSTEKTRSSLSQRKPLKFVPDPVTNTILVQGADDVQLAEVERLIAVYDRIEPADSNAVRRTQMMTLRYGDAKKVADVVKDVYRDLLSPNDKALAANNQQQQREQQQQQYAPSLFSYLTANNNEAEKNIPRFKGMLSVGIDELTNTVVVSAPQLLLDDVTAMITELDLAARPLRPVTQILKLNQPGTVEYLREALSEPNGRSAPRQSPSAAQNGAKPQNGNRSEGRAGSGGGRNRGDRSPVSGGD